VTHEPPSADAAATERRVAAHRASRNGLTTHDDGQRQRPTTTTVTTERRGDVPRGDNRHGGHQESYPLWYRPGPLCRLGSTIHSSHHPVIPVIRHSSPTMPPDVARSPRIERRGLRRPSPSSPPSEGPFGWRSQPNGGLLRLLDIPSDNSNRVTKWPPEYDLPSGWGRPNPITNCLWEEGFPKANSGMGESPVNDLIPISEAPLSPDRNPANVYLASLAPTGRRTMAGRLAMVARDILGFADPQFVPWHELRYQHLAAIRTRLQELGYSPATVNAVLYAIRGVARAAFNLELMDADSYQRIRDVRPVRGERLPAGRALTLGELSGLMDTCGKDAGPAGVRDAAVIGLLYAGGLRRAEAAALRLRDYSPETGELRVLGKGDKQRNIYLDNGAADAMADWILVRGDGDGPLLLAINKGGVIQDHGITDQAIYNLLRKRAKQAGVRDCSCHDLRRSFISDLLDAGADISTVAKLAGHAQVQTSARYDRRGEDAKKKAVALLHLPYRRRTTLPTGEPGE